MITRKRWTAVEDNTLLEFYKDAKEAGYSDDDLFKLMEDVFPGRTQKALQKRYYVLTSDKSKVAAARRDDRYTAFLDGLESLRTSYDALAVENQQLKKRVAELEQKEDDFDALTQIMDRARKLAFLVEEEDKVHFRMDSNGNLERVE